MADDTVKAGGTVRLGGYDWRVLEATGENALIITESIIEKRAYNTDKADVAWEACTLRAYLNGEFYNRFSASDKARIAAANVRNADNPWYGTGGGPDTQDKIFLLSIEEVIRHFGDSGQLQNRNPVNSSWIDDQYNGRRAAAYDGTARWWWLRSPGIRYHAADVHHAGGVVIHGRRVDDGSGGIRPALILKQKP
jgi:hypothetical protein